MDGVSLLLVQISMLFLLIPIYIAVSFIIYKIYYYEQLISSTDEFKNVKRFISRLNEPRKDRSRDLSEITELAILVAKSAGEKLFNVFVNTAKHADHTERSETPKLSNSAGMQQSKTNSTGYRDSNATIEKLCGFVCGAVCDLCCGESNF